MTEHDKAALLEHLLTAVGPSSRSYFRRHAESFLSWVENRDLDAGAVRGWIERLRAAHYADGTVHQGWAVVRRLFIVNHLEWPFHRGDAPVVREQQVYAPRLSVSAVEALVDIVRGKRRPEGSIEPNESHVALLCLSTVWGFRREEMSAMVPEFLDLPNSLLFVETAKRGRQRWHYLPDFLIPPLQEWGFTIPLRPGAISETFTQLKGMLGYSAPEVGWHAIRRAAIAAAWAADFKEPEIHTFYRWKRSTSSMALRYATSQVVGPGEEEGRDIDLVDRQVDEAFYARHPFPQFWR